jgi:hypothetical protein
MAGLIVIAIVLMVLTRWFWRATRPEPESLARLEVMSTKRWLDDDYDGRRNQLSKAREFKGGDGPIATDLVPQEPRGSIRVDRRSLAQLASAETTADPLADEDLLRRLGLDDDSLRLRSGTGWSAGDGEPAESAGAAMEPMFDVGDGPPPKIWEPADDFDTDDTDERLALAVWEEATGDGQGEQQRLGLPGEPLL